MNTSRSTIAACWMPATLLLLFAGCASVPKTPAAPAAPTSAAAGATTIVAVAAPAAPSITLPQFLGLDKALGGVCTLADRLRNRLGTYFPGLEAKPPVLALTDPANSGPDASPAVQAAAAAKAEEDQAAQKAKAIKYLASKGCGECFPDTEAALHAALDDCAEVIRYETVKGLRGSTGGKCNCCRENSCCSPKLLKKLYDLAYERDDSGCFVESSARVRRNARLVICQCGGVPPLDPQRGPLEGPGGGPAPVPTVAVDGSLDEPFSIDALYGDAPSELAETQIPFNMSALLGPGPFESPSSADSAAESGTLGSVADQSGLTVGQMVRQSAAQQAPVDEVSLPFANASVAGQTPSELSQASALTTDRAAVRRASGFGVPTMPAGQVKTIGFVLPKINEENAVVPAATEAEIPLPVLP
ncbi:MAG: hypothetical protein CBB71_07235 [Rhodopirellula sp. TMED11]|nr:MAG: hypothetical protein CBB71_07235 [Rhodopirellula sp. TMED11]